MNAVVLCGFLSESLGLQAHQQQISYLRKIIPDRIPVLFHLPTPNEDLPPCQIHGQAAMTRQGKRLLVAGCGSGTHARMRRWQFVDGTE